MQSNAGDTRATSTLWLIEHERDNPMVLAQSEHEREDAHGALERILKAHRTNGLQVDPPLSKLEVGRRYDVHDASGWSATYWLSVEKLAQDDGMLTAITSPAAKQHAHRTRPSNSH